MPTDTAPAMTWKKWEKQILSTEEWGPGELRHEYRWTVEGLNGETSGTAHAYERVTPYPHHVLEARWSGLVYESPGEGYTDLGDDLTDAITRLVEGMTRREMEDEMLIDGSFSGVDVAMDVDGLIKVIQEWMVERAAKVAA